MFLYAEQEVTICSTVRPLVVIYSGHSLGVVLTLSKLLISY